MAPRYLLDTNVVSEFERAVLKAPLAEWLETVEDDDIGIPLNVLAEIQRGILRIAGQRPDRAAELQDWLDALAGSAATNIVHPNRESELIVARMAETPALRGFFMPRGRGAVQLGDDPRVAALAISLDAVVVTFDVDDFLRIHDAFPLPGLFHPGRHEWVVGDGPPAGFAP